MWFKELSLTTKELFLGYFEKNRSQTYPWEFHPHYYQHFSNANTNNAATIYCNNAVIMLCIMPITKCTYFQFRFAVNLAILKYLYQNHCLFHALSI